MPDKDRSKPTFANDTDGLQAPSIETTPGTIPQTPLPGRAPSRPDADHNSTVGGDGDAATDRPSRARRP